MSTALRSNWKIILRLLNFIPVSLFQADKANHREEPFLAQQTQIFRRGAFSMHNIYIAYYIIMVALVLFLLLYLLNIRSYLSEIGQDGPLKIFAVRRTRFVMLIVILSIILLINFQHNVGKT